MIVVIASIQVTDNRLEDFMKIFKENIPAVLAEEGCLEYMPTVDAESGISRQDKNHSLITLVERWQSIEALQAHLQTPHMASYAEKVKDIATTISLKILTPV